MRLLDIFALGFGKGRVLFGIAVDAPEIKEVEKADGAGESKAPAPAGEEQKCADQRNADGGGKFGSAIKERRGKAALVLRKPHANGFGIRWKRGRFTDA